MALLLVLLLVSPGLAVRTTRNGQEQEVVDQNFEDMQNNPQLQALYGPEYHYRETLNQSQQSFRPQSANTPQNQSFRRAYYGISLRTHEARKTNRKYKCRKCGQSGHQYRTCGRSGTRQYGTQINRQVQLRPMLSLDPVGDGGVRSRIYSEIITSQWVSKVFNNHYLGLFIFFCYLFPNVALATWKRRNSYYCRKRWTTRNGEAFDLRIVVLSFFIQSGKCQICKLLLDFRNGSPWRHRPCADHCHATNTFRALLCSSCNLFIGQAYERIGNLAEAVVYVDAVRRQ